MKVSICPVEVHIFTEYNFPSQREMLGFVSEFMLIDQGYAVTEQVIAKLN